MKVKLSHSLEDLVGLFFMSFWIRGGNGEVIHVDDEPYFNDHVLEEVIHKVLECGREVVKAKEHDHGFKKSFVSDEDCFPLMAILDTDVIVSPMNIEFRKVMSIFQLVHEVRDKRERVDIMGGVFIEVAIVLAGMKFAVFLLYKEEERHLRRIGGVYLFCCYVFFQEVLGCFHFIWRELVDFAYLRHKRFIQVDFMIIWSGRKDMVDCFFREDLGKDSIF